MSGQLDPNFCTNSLLHRPAVKWLSIYFRNLKMSQSTRTVSRTQRTVWSCLLLKELFKLKSSAPITKRAQGHKGGCLSNLVLKLKKAICTYCWKSLDLIAVLLGKVCITNCFSINFIKIETEI